jgi:hypothetical protein
MGDYADVASRIELENRTAVMADKSVADKWAAIRALPIITLSDARDFLLRSLTFCMWLMLYKNNPELTQERIAKLGMNDDIYELVLWGLDIDKSKEEKPDTPEDEMQKKTEHPLTGSDTTLDLCESTDLR